MLIRSQKGEFLVQLENGMVMENGVQIYFITNTNHQYTLGKYASANSPNHEITVSIIKSIYDAKSQGENTFQMP